MIKLIEQLMTMRRWERATKIFILGVQNWSGSVPAIVFVKYIRRAGEGPESRLFAQTATD